MKAFKVVSAIKFIMRVLLSPVVFFITACVMIIFPGTLLLIIGIVQLIVKLIGVDIDDSYNELLAMTTSIVWVPFANSWYFVAHAKLMN